MVTATAETSVRRRQPRFYTWMAVAFAVLAFGAFAPTYWLQLPAGTFIGPPILHLHGALFSAWLVFLMLQTWWVGSGRIQNHRAWGVAGVALATAMVCVGLTAAALSMSMGLSSGYGERARAFLILPVSSIALFAGFVVAAMFTIKHREFHKRLMLLATLGLLQAAMGRVVFALVTGGGPGLRPGLGPPPLVSLAAAPSLALLVFVAIGMVYDWRTRGRPHPAWLIGGAITTMVVLLRAPVSATPAWQSFSHLFEHFAG